MDDDGKRSYKKPPSLEGYPVFWLGKPSPLLLVNMGKERKDTGQPQSTQVEKLFAPDLLRKVTRELFLRKTETLPPIRARIDSEDAKARKTEMPTVWK